MKKTHILLAVAVLALVCLNAYLLLAQPARRFDGERMHASAPERFSLRFTWMNGQTAKTLPLQAGDALRVAWEIQTGSVDVTVARAGAAPLYRGRGQGDAASFTLPIPESGDYTITVTGKSAAGWLECVQEQPE